MIRKSGVPVFRLRVALAQACDWLDASAGEARPESFTLKQETKGGRAGGPTQ